MRSILEQDCIVAGLDALKRLPVVSDRFAKPNDQRSRIKIKWLVFNENAGRQNTPYI
jgi:hypothetical protein